MNSRIAPSTISIHSEHERRGAKIAAGQGVDLELMHRIDLHFGFGCHRETLLSREAPYLALSLEILIT
jgi:hypothetical protein